MSRLKSLLENMVEEKLAIEQKMANNMETIKQKRAHLKIEIQALQELAEKVESDLTPIK